MTNLMAHGLGNGRAGHPADETAAVQSLRPILAEQITSAAAAGHLSPSTRAATVEQLITVALDNYARQALRNARAPLAADAEARVRQALPDGARRILATP
jgi:hypothetical protein